MGSFKVARLEEDMKRVISEVITNEVKDPDVEGIVSITKISITPDLKFAKIYTSIYAGNKEKVLSGIKRASSYIRKQVAQRVKMRIVPELNFVLDDAIEYGAHMDKVIKDLNISKE